MAQKLLYLQGHKIKSTGYVNYKLNLIIFNEENEIDVDYEVELSKSICITSLATT